MFRFLNTVASASGELPHVGDCDDGRTEFLIDDLEQMLLLPVRERNSLRVPQLLGLGLRLFGEGDGPDDDAVATTLERIETNTGLTVLDLPLERAYHLDLGFSLTGQQRSPRSEAPGQYRPEPFDRLLLAAIASGSQAEAQRNVLERGRSWPLRVKCFRRFVSYRASLHSSPSRSFLRPLQSSMGMARAGITT